MEETSNVPEEKIPTEQSQETPPPGSPESKNPRKGFLGTVDRFFGITKSGSNFKREIIAGLTTFMAMVYILVVNPSIFTATFDDGTQIVNGISFGGIYIATAIGAVAGTLLMAFLAKMPLAQASGMGINAFIVHTLISGNSGLTYANCMMFTLLEGLVFVLLTVTGLRKKIFQAIPAGVRHAIPVGIGLFIAFIGMQNAGIIVAKEGTLVSFASFNFLDKNNHFLSYDDGSVGGMLPAFIALLGVGVIAILSKKKVKGAVLWGILGSAAAFYVFAGIAFGVGSSGANNFFASVSVANPFDAFKHWGTESVGKVFTDGFNFTQYLGIKGNNAGTLVVLLLTSALSLCMIDMFDTIGTLYGACAKGNLLDENGTPIRMERMMLSDAIATSIGAIAGTSTVTTFVESSSGVAAGGKTGFAALSTAVFFIIAMFLSPIAQLIPSCATATALIWVGVLMMSSVTKIDWSDPLDAIVAFLTFIVMVLGYSISKGIGIGILFYIFVKVCTGKIKETTVPTWIIGVLFLAMFALT